MGTVELEKERKKELIYVGKNLPRIDSLEKVTGSAKYCYDLFFPNMLYAAVVSSKYAHAFIKRIDTTEALKLQGVRAIITSEDVPKKRKGQLFFDRPIITKKARYIGDVIAAIAADTEEIAYEAARKIKVEYEKLPAIFDVKEAFNINPKVIVHEDLDELIEASQGHPLFEQDAPFFRKILKDRPNVFANFEGEIGEVDKAFKEADFIVENEFKTGRVYHAAVEPHVAIANYNQHTGEVTIWSSCQCPYRAKMELCYLFDLEPSKVTFINPYVGGGFGSKGYLTIEDIALALSMKTNRAVRLAYSRRTDFLSTVIRNATYSRIRDAVKNGKILAREMEVLFDAGAYNDATFKFTRSAIFAAIASYSIPNFRFKCYGVYTNTPVGGAYRGFGIQQVLWPVERQMDILAEKLSIDPVEIRKRHLPKKDGLNPLSKESLGDVKANECLEKVIEAIDYYNKKSEKKSNGKWKKGIGITMANKPIHLHHPSATVKIDMNGFVEVRVGVQEIGTGSLTALAQISSEALKTPMEKVKIVWGDTRLTPYDEGTAGSRVTALTGNAVLRACMKAREKALKLASKKLGIPWHELEYKNGEIFSKSFQDKKIHINELFYKTMYGLPSASIEHGEIIGNAIYDLKEETSGLRRFHQSYTWGAQGMELEVNTETGKVNILKVITAIDVGKAINPELVKSQIEGGVAMGIGLALYEELILNEQGEIINEHFLDYKIPTPFELPLDMETIIVESYDSYGPFGAKAVGEFPLCITPQTVASAIYDAIGIQFYEIPITSEKIFFAIHGVRK
ncbi:MAG: xanthine dehydrogenase family protein molybdopterin-binding subunit [Nitrososphaerales archaeon]